MPVAASSQSPATTIVIVVGGVLLALMFGLVGGLFGFEAQALVLLLGVPAIALLVDQRLGLFLFIMLVPYNGAENIPREAQNIVFFGIALLFVARLLMNRAMSSSFQMPLPKEFILYALLFTATTVVGVTHLREITPAYLFRIGVDAYGLKEYVAGFYARQFTLLIMSAIIVWLLVAKRTRPDWIVNTALASGALFVVLMLGLIALRGFPLEELRSRNFFMVLGRQSNAVGGLLMILLPCSLYMWEMANGRLRRLVLMVVTLALVTGITLSASRGAILGMLAVFIIYAIEFRRVRTAFAGALVLSLAALLAPQSIQERMVQGLESRVMAVGPSAGFDDEVTSGRLYIWSRLAPEVLDSPVIGSGLGSSQWSQFARSGEYFATHPHSFYLELLMDTGIAGAVIVFLLYRYLWRSFRMLGRDQRLSSHIRGYFRGASVGLLGYVAYGVVNGHWYPSQDQVFFWVAAGLAIGMQAVLGPQPSEAVVQSRRTASARTGRLHLHGRYR